MLPSLSGNDESPTARFYLYAICLRNGWGKMLLDEIGNCAEMEIILPEYHAIEAILSGNTARYIDHVACELRPICKEIGKRILFVCGRKNLAEKKSQENTPLSPTYKLKEIHRRDILLHGIIPGRPPLR